MNSEQPSDSLPPDRAADSREGQQFARLSQDQPPGIVEEFVDFLRHNKRWWLTPIILIMLLKSLLIVLTNTAVAPFIYVLF